MKLNAKETVKVLLSREYFKQKDLAPMLAERFKKPYTPNGLSQKLRRGTITFDEVQEIADILGYDVQMVKRNQ